MGWKELLAHWDLIVPDLSEVYSIDVWASRDRCWPWLRDHILGLLSTPRSRLGRALSPKSPAGTNPPRR